MSRKAYKTMIWNEKSFGKTIELRTYILKYETTKINASWSHGCDLLIVVSPDGIDGVREANVRISMNQKCYLNADEYMEINQKIQDTLDRLKI
jgi:hypothetical protein